MRSGERGVMSQVPIHTHCRAVAESVSLGGRTTAMTRASSIRELYRWLRPAGAVVAAYFAALYFRLLALMFGPFPKDLAEPTAGFTMGLLIVLAGSLFAPRRRLAVALVLAVAGTGVFTGLMSFHPLGTLAGGIVAVVFVAWWFRPHRTCHSTWWVGIGVCAAFFIFIGVVFIRFTDRLAQPEALSPELAQTLGTNALLVTAFYRYDRGGFIDQEWLWRLDAKPEGMAMVVSGLGLRSTNQVPQSFWRMSPHYWPRSMPAGGEAFQSPMFTADSRGADGAHYLLVHDKAQGRAFVWVKDNF